MIRGLTILLLCQLLGEIVSRALALPVPGPVLGLVLLVAGLHLRARRHGADRVEGTGVTRAADGLLQNLGLLFVPAGVGVVQYAGLLKSQALALGCALLGSTAVTLAVTVLVFVGVSRLIEARAAKRGAV